MRPKTGIHLLCVMSIAAGLALARGAGAQECPVSQIGQPCGADAGLCIAAVCGDLGPTPDAPLTTRSCGGCISWYQIDYYDGGCSPSDVGKVCGLDGGGICVRSFEQLDCVGKTHISYGFTTAQCVPPSWLDSGSMDGSPNDGSSDAPPSFNYGSFDAAPHPDCWPPVDDSGMAFFDVGELPPGSGEEAGVPAAPDANELLPGSGGEAGAGTGGGTSGSQAASVPSGSAGSPKSAGGSSCAVSIAHSPAETGAVMALISALALGARRRRSVLRAAARCKA
jgi:MYXO-CTERM domain-containing protein